MRPGSTLYLSGKSPFCRLCLRLVCNNKLSPKFNINENLIKVVALIKNVFPRREGFKFNGAIRFGCGVHILLGNLYAGKVFPQRKIYFGKIVYFPLPFVRFDGLVVQISFILFAEKSQETLGIK